MFATIQRINMLLEYSLKGAISSIKISNSVKYIEKYF